MAFGDRLIEARKRRKLTQEGLAKLSNVSQQAISFIEQGKRSPTEETMIMLAKALRIPVSDLIDIEKKPTPEDELQEENAAMLSELTEQELQQVLAFVEGLKAARAVKDSPDN